jgi:hypothetical protein
LSTAHADDVNSGKMDSVGVGDDPGLLAEACLQCAVLRMKWMSSMEL